MNTADTAEKIFRRSKAALTSSARSRFLDVAMQGALRPRRLFLKTP
jgi:hypothetical protein